MNQNQNNPPQDSAPPRWADRLLEWYCSDRFLEEVQGDLYERYFISFSQKGRASANREFIIQVFRFMRPFRMKKLEDLIRPQFYPDMIAHYLKTAFRNLKRFKGFSFLNILGLTLGMTACILILRYVSMEWSYDRFHEKATQLVRVHGTEIRNGITENEIDINTGSAISVLLKENVPEIELSTRLHPWYGDMVVTTHEGTDNRTSYFENNGLFVDRDFLEMFSFPFVNGDPGTALTQKDQVIITRSIATKYFGSSDRALGQIIRIDGTWAWHSFTIVAVVEEPPENTHLDFDFLLLIDHVLDHPQYNEDDGWGWENFLTYVQLSSGSEPGLVIAKAESAISSYLPEDFVGDNAYSLSFFPVQDIHLYSLAENELKPSGNHEAITFFALIALLILLIAWINYLNLSTSRAMQRAVEVGIRKTIGAFRQQITMQFLFESLFLNSIALVFAIALSIYLEPILSEVIGLDLSQTYQNNSLFWIGFGAIVLIGALLSGLYPALILSAFRPVEVLKGLRNKRIAGISLRKVLVVAQFATSVALIAGTLSVYHQVSFMKTDDLGMDLEHILVVDGPKIMPEGLDRAGRYEKYKAFKTTAASVPGVQQVSASGSIPGGGYDWGTELRGLHQPPEATQTVSVIFVDEKFSETYGMELLAGQGFGEEFSFRPIAWVNEKVVEVCDLGSPQHAVGQFVAVSGDTALIVGVLKNYAWNSNRKEVPPMILTGPDPGSSDKFSIKLSEGEYAETIASIEATYTSTFPGNPFQYRFQDDFFDEQYKADQRFGNIFSLFTLLAIIVACLGLFGLASFTATQRIKEIGIRKVVGASIGSLLVMLSKDFMILVTLSIAVGLAAAYWITSSWLEEFPKQIELGLWFFGWPALAVTTIAIGTISWKTIQTARTNPVKALRYE